MSGPEYAGSGRARIGNLRPFNESSTFATAAGRVVQGTHTAFNSAFGSVNLQTTIANSHDNALEANLRHTGRSFFLQLGYTWSRSLEPIHRSIIEPCRSGLPRRRGAKPGALCLEGFNIFNHSQFFGPAAVNGNISSQNFGKVQSASPPRLLQAAVRVLF